MSQRSVEAYLKAGLEHLREAEAKAPIKEVTEA